jgi:hypothetical protein
VTDPNITAFALNACTAAIARRDSQSPSVAIVQFTGGINVCGREAVEQLLAAARHALEEPCLKS